RLRRIKKEGTIVFDSEHLRKDGGVFPIETTARTVNLGDRTIILSVIRDITERKKAEEALRESEERYRALLELGERIGEAVVMLQDDERGAGMHVYASDEWSRITGYSREELLNMSMVELIHESDREKALERHERRILGEVLSGLYELTIVRKDGSEVPVEVTYAYSSYKGKPANVGYIRDISERKKMEEQLIVTDRLASIGELASGIAHELNNPLTGIIGFSELLLNKDIPEDVREDLQIINREAKRTSQVVKNLLTFARKHETTKQLVDINQAIKSVLDLRAYEQKVHNIAIVTNFDPGLPEITADIFRLQQVFINIVINAEYFMVQSHGRGTLTITTERRGDAIRASFANDGPDIKKEHLRHLFDPFFTTKEVGKGTGLGLSICHGIVTEHGGQIHAESEPGKGATFIVELPIK
ncbi:MAG: PAS domain S-box protein, partial [Dehalococcoidia bacterium]